MVKTILILLMVVIVQGCESQRVEVQGANIVPDFATQAEQDFPRYKIEKKDFYGFRLMEPIDVNTFEILSKPGMKDKKTGGDIYIFKDRNSNFDSIHITLNNGLLSKIDLVKIFTHYSDADNFAKILYQKSKETYPQEAFHYGKVENESYVIDVLFYNSKEEWKKHYIQHIDMKKRVSGLHPYLFHEFLTRFGIMLTNTRSSLWAVMVQYETKLYRDSEASMNEQRKKHLKDL